MIVTLQANGTYLSDSGITVTVGPTSATTSIAFTDTLARSGETDKRLAIKAARLTERQIKTEGNLIQSLRDSDDNKANSLSGYAILRGGSWYHGRQDAQASNRYSDHEDYRNYTFGFRVVTTP